MNHRIEHARLTSQVTVAQGSLSIAQSRFEHARRRLAQANRLMARARVTGEPEVEFARRVLNRALRTINVERGEVRRRQAEVRSAQAVLDGFERKNRRALFAPLRTTEELQRANA